MRASSTIIKITKRGENQNDTNNKKEEEISHLKLHNFLFFFIFYKIRTKKKYFLGSFVRDVQYLGRVEGIVNYYTLHIQIL